MMKKDKRQILYEKYMYQKGLNHPMRKDNIELAKSFGYIDGFFKEHIYEETVLIKKDQEYSDAYYKSYEIGINDRINMDSMKEVKKEKEEFIKKLVIHDMLNNIKRENFTKEAQDFYNKYAEYGEISLKTGKITASKGRK